MSSTDWGHRAFQVLRSVFLNGTRFDKQLVPQNFTTNLTWAETCSYIPLAAEITVVETHAPMSHFYFIFTNLLSIWGWQIMMEN